MILLLLTGGGGKHGPKVYPNIEARLTETSPETFREVAMLGPQTPRECGVLQITETEGDRMDLSQLGDVQQLEL